jgi:hypothetical protein
MDAGRREEKALRHGIVYAEQGVYAGWPANHGAWQWGDEFLVGFLTGKYGRKSMHNCLEPFTKLQARSVDGGETWTVEKPNVDFEAHWTVDPPEFNLRDSIIRVCGCYDHGGDECVDEGGFYLSEDKGKTWHGAYAFRGIEKLFAEPYGNTSRTAVLGDLIFLSRNERGRFATDSTFVAKQHGDGFLFLSWVCDEEARAVMPAVAVSGNGIVATLRRRHYHRRDCWIDAYGSDDGGQSWRFLSQVDSTGGHNGNPPALIALPDGRLVCTYADRTEREMRARVSEDGGKSWSVPHITLRKGDSDIGYPRLFLRNDGVVVCVYYFVDAASKHNHISSTTFKV